MLVTIAARITPVAESNCLQASQPGGHQAETDFERGEIAEAVREFPALPRGEGVSQAEQRGEGEIALVAEIEPLLHEKIKAVEIKNRGEGVESLDDKAGVADFLIRGHGRLEISPMALRQYHLTASDIGGSSLSNSAAEHQRMS